MRAPLALPLVATLLLGPAMARAAVGFTITAPPGGVVGGSTTVIPFTVTNTGTEVLWEFDFKLRNNYFSINAASGPTSDFVCTIRTSGARVTCTAPCTSTGLAPGVQGKLTVTLEVKYNSAIDATETMSFTAGGTTGCATTTTASVDVPIPIRMLAIVGSAAPANLLGPPNGSAITWTITNRSNTTQTGITVTPTVSPGTGATGTCTSIASLAVGQSQAITCTYAFSAPATYVLTAFACNAGATASSPYASATVSVGTASPSWTRDAIACGRPNPVLRLRIDNTSGATVSQVNVRNGDASGWALSGASATGGLGFAPGASSAADVVFTGALAPGASSTVEIAFSAVPPITATRLYPFSVVLTPLEGSAWAVTAARTVALVIPIPDVVAFTVRNDAGGKLLTWVNTSIPGTDHAGVVVFAAAGAQPPLPEDFQAYTAGAGGVVHTSPDAAETSFTHAGAGSDGNVNYRVCNRDKYLVYSGCRTGLQQGEGWLSSELYPTSGTLSGWVHALGGNALVRAGLLPGSRVGQADNVPAMAVLDTGTGTRSFTPVAIPALPSINSPAAVLSDGPGHTAGTPVVVAADQGTGVPPDIIAHVSAVRLDAANAGQYKWSTPFPGESFTAGVSGVVYSAASLQFQQDFGSDVLFVGSATTGNVYAIDGVTGAARWSTPASAGGPVHGLVLYDPASNYIYVPTSGAGVQVFDLTGRGNPTPTPTPLATWQATADPGLRTGDHRHCIRTASSRAIACIDAGGTLRVFNKLTGVLLAPAFDTGIASPTALARVSGSAGQGFVVSNSSTARVLSWTYSQAQITPVGDPWTLGASVTLSTPSVFADAGYYVVGASDRSLHRISLSTGLELLPASPAISTRNASVLLAQPFYDGPSARFLFGTDDGHLWAIPRWFP